MTEDIELLSRYVNDRSEAAFAALVQRHLRLVYCAALRRTDGNAPLAEDVTQIVFTMLAQNAAKLQRHTILSGWLYVTTRHAAANAMRTEKRRKTREQEAYTMQEPTDSSRSEADWSKLRPELDSVMDELSELDRNAVLLRFFENQPYVEIGASFQISEDAARRRVDRALEKMRALLVKRGLTSTAAALGGMLVAQTSMAAPAGLAAAVTGTALTGAAASAGTVASLNLITFMTTNKIMAGLAGAVAFVAAGSALYEYRESRLTAAELATMSQECAALHMQLQHQSAKTQDATGKSRSAEGRAAALEKSLAEAEASTRSSAGPAAKVVSNPPIANRMDVLFANPEYAKLELRRFAAAMKLQYGPLYRKIGLSSAKIGEFENLMIERQQSVYDMMAAARSNSVSLNDPTLVQLQDPAFSTIDASLRGLLGEAGYAEYRAYSDAKTLTARSSVDSLAGNLYYTETPLTPAQAERLTQIIVTNTPEASGDGFMRTPGQSNWDAIYTQAKDVLTSSQLATFQTVNESTQLAMQESLLSEKLLQESAVANLPRN